MAISKYKQDLSNKINEYNTVVSELGTHRGDLGYQASCGLIRDIEHLIKLLETEGCVVVLNRPDCGIWSIVSFSI